MEPASPPDLDSRPFVGKPEGRAAQAGWAALEAAWAFDDAGDADRAQRCRLRALELWSEADGAGQAITDHGLPTTQLLLADVSRRAGHFEDARACCHRALSGRPGEPFRSLLELELELITSEDTAAHSVSEAVVRWE